jgi:hypothetical protein
MEDLTRGAACIGRLALVGLALGCGRATVDDAPASGVDAGEESSVASDGDATTGRVDASEDAGDVRYCMGLPDDLPGDNCVPHPVRTCMGLPDDKPGLNCYPPQPDGGIYGRCRQYGEDIEGKVVGAYCCEGLTKISQTFLTDAGCMPAENVPISVLICAPCGDGLCDPLENACNCPRDCAPTDQ